MNLVVVQAGVPSLNLQERKINLVTYGCTVSWVRLSLLGVSCSPPERNGAGSRSWRV